MGCRPGPAGPRSLHPTAPRPLHTTMQAARAAASSMASHMVAQAARARSSACAAPAAGLGSALQRAGAGIPQQHRPVQQQRRAAAAAARPSRQRRHVAVSVAAPLAAGPHTSPTYGAEMQAAVAAVRLASRLCQARGPRGRVLANAAAPRTSAARRRWSRANVVPVAHLLNLPCLLRAPPLTLPAPLLPPPRWPACRRCRCS